MTRTDIHRPSAPEFDPQSYDLVGVFDLLPEVPGEARQRRLAVNKLLKDGYKFFGSMGQCGHCGAHLRYAALMTHPSTMEMMYVGEDCLDNRFSLSKEEFSHLRETARLHRERRNREERIQALIKDNPHLVWLTYPEALDGEFLQSVSGQFLSSGELSERQIEAVERGLVYATRRADQAREREREAQRLLDSGVHVPQGRTVVEGKVASIKYYDGPYGAVHKMLVVTDAGWKVFGSIPSVLPCEIGDRVRFTATITPSEDDALFGYYKRPTKPSMA